MSVGGVTCSLEPTVALSHLPLGFAGSKCANPSAAMTRLRAAASGSAQRYLHLHASKDEFGRTVALDGTAGYPTSLTAVSVYVLPGNLDRLTERGIKENCAPYLLLARSQFGGLNSRYVSRRRVVSQYVV